MGQDPHSQCFKCLYHIPMTWILWPLPSIKYCHPAMLCYEVMPLNATWNPDQYPSHFHRWMHMDNQGGSPFGLHWPGTSLADQWEFGLTRSALCLSPFTLPFSQDGTIFCHLCLLAWARFLRWLCHPGKHANRLWIYPKTWRQTSVEPQQPLFLTLRRTQETVRNPQLPPAWSLLILQKTVIFFRSLILPCLITECWIDRDLPLSDW